jgi:hypothetical protein
LGRDEVQLWALTAVTVVVSSDLKDDVIVVKQGKRRNDFQDRQDVVDGRELASVEQASLRDFSILSALNNAAVDGHHVEVGRRNVGIVQSDFNSHLIERELIKVRVEDLDGGVEGSSQVKSDRVLVGVLVLDEKNRGDVDNLDIEDDLGLRGIEGRGSIIEGEVDSVVLLAFSEVLNWTRSEEALDRSNKSVDEFASLDVRQSNRGDGVDLRAVNGGSLLAQVVIAELNDTLILSASQELDGEGISLRVNGREEELVLLLFQSDDASNLIIQARLLVKRSDVNGDDLLVGDSLVVINDTVADLAIVALGSAILVDRVAVGSLASRTEAKSGLDGTSLVLQDLVTDDSVTVVLQRQQDSGALDAVNLSELVGKDRSFNVVTAEVDHFKAGIPPILFTKVLLEGA